MFDLFQPTHLLFILLVALAVFGPKRLIEVSRQAGHFIQNLQEYKEELMDELSASPEDEGEEESSKESSNMNSSEKKG
jgi:Sec-independent protein translocase protein TatA